jgi:hypothetical protein
MHSPNRPKTEPAKMKEAEAVNKAGKRKRRTKEIEYSRRDNSATTPLRRYSPRILCLVKGTGSAAPSKTETAKMKEAEAVDKTRKRKRRTKETKHLARLLIKQETPPITRRRVSDSRMKESKGQLNEEE